MHELLDTSFPIKEWPGKVNLHSTHTYPRARGSHTSSEGTYATHLGILVVGLVIDIHGRGGVGSAGGPRDEQVVVLQHEKQVDLWVAATDVLRPE